MKVVLHRMVVATVPMRVARKQGWLSSAQRCRRGRHRRTKRRVRNQKQRINWGCKRGKASEGSEQTSRMSHKKKMAGQTELQWREPGEKVNQTAHERTSQASTGSREQAHTEPCWRAANVEVRWKKWCMSKTEQSCRQSNRLCKRSPYFLCDYGEKEAKRQNAVPAGGTEATKLRDSHRCHHHVRRGMVRSSFT